MNREELLDAIDHLIVSVKGEHPTRVAIDGVDAAGKTTIARELADRIERRARPVIRASMDGFHNPRSVRYRRGALSPEGFYRDSFDLSALINVLLAPLGPGGSCEYRTEVFDHVRDTPVSPPLAKAENGTILLFDGVFLLRNELRSYWDFSIFVKAEFQVTLERARLRDVQLLGSEDEVERRYNLRYVPGQKMYLEECEPEARADVVIDNNDADCPALVTSRAQR